MSTPVARNIAYTSKALLEWMVSASYVKIAQVDTIGETSSSTEDIDITLLEDDVRQRVGGAVLDPGDLDFTLFFDPGSTQHADIIALLGVTGTAGTRSFRVTLPGFSPFIFDAFVKGVGNTAIEKNGTWKVKVTLGLNTRFGQAS